MKNKLSHIQKMTFSTKDLQQFQDKGITVAQVKQQIQNFIAGFPFMQLQKAATIGEGLLRIEDANQTAYLEKYETAIQDLTVCKFVPASGAASRMFKASFAFMNGFDGSETAYKSYLSDNSFYSDQNFFVRIKDFAFYDDLKGTLAEQGHDIEQLIENKDFSTVLKALLTEDGMDYGALPKGLLKFHRYDNEVRTPVEEHLIEGAEYCKDKNGQVYLHFTVSPQHRAKFLAKLAEVQSDYEARYNAKFDISLSEQEPYTDTLAVDMENAPFRLEDGSILFRPGGHGALIENLNRIDADIVFIKNIDNVVPDRFKETTYTYKKLIGGVLVDIQNQIFTYLLDLEAQTTVNESLIADIEVFYQTTLSTVFPAAYEALSLAEKQSYLMQKLNRPIRVCGMVKNEGEPGGGPFWTTNSDDSVSLHIVESAQINKEDATQKDIMSNSSHFNPVDVVCGLKNYKGEKFDLLQFRDPQTGFIAYKSKNGRDLKAQELPGLWNGAMADWNTLFVEVPIITFNPVKKVNDLLRDEHQA